MEPRVETNGLAPSLDDGLDVYYRAAITFVERHYPDILQKYRDLQPSSIGPEWFFTEYMWCVYVSGFNSKVVDKKFSDLLAAYKTWDYICKNEEDLWANVSNIIANRRKFNAVITTRFLLQNNGWDRFRNTFLTSIEDIGKLPYMGKVMRHHLARNIGLDTVKPDRHLVRLANHFGFSDAHTMCAVLGNRYNERIGVVDLILFYTASTYGTMELR